MKPFLTCALGPWALGAALLAGVGPAAWAQNRTPPAPSPAHVHGAQPGSPSAAVPTSPTAPSPLPDSSWQDANRAVGQFPRGHVDLLRWEQKNLPQALPDAVPADAGALTLARAEQLALQDEAKWFKPGMSALEQAELRQQRAALHSQVQKLWVDAVASRQSLAHSQGIVSLAQVGAELGQRMAQVGNWSRARQIQEEVMVWGAQTRLDQAQLQADRALHALWQRVGAGMTVQALARQLPGHLPMAMPTLAPPGSAAAPQVGSAAVPQAGSAQAQSEAPGPDLAALQAQALQAHVRWSLEDRRAQQLMAGLGLSEAEQQAAQTALAALAGQAQPLWDPRTQRWGHAFENAWQARLQADRLARQVQADVQMAWRAYQVARQTAQHTQVQLVRLHNELSQENLLRYNGMLKSTWDLLAGARTRMDSVDAALQAQRQAWRAHADLKAVLAGLPYQGADTDASAPTGAATNPAGH